MVLIRSGYVGETTGKIFVRYRRRTRRSLSLSYLEWVRELLRVSRIVRDPLKPVNVRPTTSIGKRVQYSHRGMFRPPCPTFGLKSPIRWVMEYIYSEKLAFEGIFHLPHIKPIYCETQDIYASSVVGMPVILWYKIWAWTTCPHPKSNPTH